MSWRVAESLQILLRQLNEAFPRRSKKSDGSIGDTAHSSRASDHNPNPQGVVCARDFTHDPKTGIDCNWLAEQLVKGRDPRIKYIIWQRRILSSKTAAWTWRPYSGANAHNHHLHLSVIGEARLYDSQNKWKLDFPDDDTDDVAKTVPQPELILEIPQLSTVAEPTGNQSEAPSPAQNDALPEIKPPAEPSSQLPSNNIMNKADEVGNKLQAVQGTLDKFGFSIEDAKRSVGTYLLTGFKAILAPIMVVGGVLLDHWELLLIAALLAVLAYLLWDRSGKRLADAKAGVPPDVVKEIIKNGNG